jgi:hypothetical protein
MAGVHRAKLQCRAAGTRKPTPTATPPGRFPATQQPISAGNPATCRRICRIPLGSWDLPLLTARCCPALGERIIHGERLWAAMAACHPEDKQAAGGENSLPSSRHPDDGKRCEESRTTEGFQDEFVSSLGPLASPLPETQRGCSLLAGGRLDPVRPRGFTGAGCRHRGAMARGAAAQRGSCAQRATKSARMPAQATF